MRITQIGTTPALPYHIVARKRNGTMILVPTDQLTGRPIYPSATRYQGNYTLAWRRATPDDQPDAARP